MSSVKPDFGALLDHRGGGSLKSLFFGQKCHAAYSKPAIAPPKSVAGSGFHQLLKLNKRQSHDKL